MMTMESYVQKLLANQQSENALRDERDRMLKRHERELEDIDEQMVAIIQQRNEIMKEFQQFLIGQNASLPSTTTMIPGSTTQINRTLSSIMNGTNHDDMNLAKFPEQSMTLPTATTTPFSSSSSSANVPKSSRTVKIIPRLKISKTVSNMINLNQVPESPTTNQIESMLHKVRQNSLDSQTLDKCIDMLSTKIKIKDPESRTDGTDSNESNIANKGCSPAKNSVESKPQTKSSLAPSSSSSSPTSSSTTSSPSTLVNQTKSEQQQKQQRKRYETPEERRRRIERVLCETPANRTSSTLTKSFSTLNANDLLKRMGNGNNNRATLKTPTTTTITSIASNRNINRYANRSNISNSNSISTRNHSLSPLRFGMRKALSDDQSQQSSSSISRQQSEQQTEPGTPTTLDESCTKDSFGLSRRYRSEQQLFFDDSSLASFDDESFNEFSSIDYDEKASALNENLGDCNEFEPIEEEHHLLAPSKVAKQQDAFKQVFFPQDKREKPLMSREELASIKKKKTMVKSKSIGWNTSMMSREERDQLRLEHLGHLRRSISPETRQKDRELIQLNNTGKFRCYQDFWENKTKEILDKKQKFERWQQQQANPLTLSSTSLTKTNPQTKLINPTSSLSNTLNVNVQRNPNSKFITSDRTVPTTATAGTFLNSRNPSIVQAKTFANPVTQSSNLRVSKTIGDMVTVRSGLDSVKSINDRPSKITINSNRIISVAKPIIKQSSSNRRKSDGTKKDEEVEEEEKIDDDRPSKGVTIQLSKKIYTVTNKKTEITPQPISLQSSVAQKTDSIAKTDPEIEKDKLIEKLRYFKQDIQRQKMKQQLKRQQQIDQQQHQQQQRYQSSEIGKQNSPERFTSNEIGRTSPSVPSKNLDLQYLARHNQGFFSPSSCLSTNPVISDGQASVKTIGKNRIRLVRSYSREEPSGEDENVMNGNDSKSQCSMASMETVATPIRSTYF
ncbi:nuclear receptor subfamily 2 group E member 1-like [Sarcoptes scabiei]|nr:nuclear receptor subfamily 2 group E member 1-like [Sarcoptes scabiei]